MAHTYQALWPAWGQISWRTLSWAEYKSYSNRYDPRCPMSVYIDIYRACVILGPNIEDATAGIVSFIGEFCFHGSAFSEDFTIVNAKLNQARSKVTNSYLYHLKSMMVSMYKYTFEQIDTWDDETFMNRAAAMELIIGKAINPQDSNAKPEEPKQGPRPVSETVQHIAKRTQERDSNRAGKVVPR
jgi:hypothetical protein